MTDESKKTQWQAIYAYMMAGNRITPIKALSQFGCMRLGARVWDIQHNTGRKVSRRIVTRGGVNGPVRYGEYWIDEQERNRNINPNKEC